VMDPNEGLQWNCEERIREEVNALNPHNHNPTGPAGDEPGSVLFIGAHPDDIEFYCGGTVYDFRRRGAPVTFLIATRGGKGRAGQALETLEGLRTRHQLDAARLLGGVGVEMLHYPDKGLAGHVESFADGIRAFVDRETPAIIFCWDPDFISNPHPDHQAAARACRIALGDTDHRVLYFGTRRPDIFVSLDAAAFRAKMRALRAHRTETPWYYWPLLSRAVKRRLSWGGDRFGCKYAESYRAAS